MIWKCDELESFFGVKPFRDVVAELGRIHMFRCSGQRLQYAVWIHDDVDWVSVSGDASDPFCADSFYEVYVPCDSIQTFADHNGQLALAFYYGPPSDRMNLRLTIMRRLDGDLKVWPSFPAPEGHFFSQAGAKNPKLG